MPIKKYLLHEVAELTGRHPNTIKKYEKLGLITKADRTLANHRLFDPEVIEQIRALNKVDLQKQGGISNV